MNETKPFWQSKAIWANLATIVVGLAVSMGWLSPEQGADVSSSFPDLAVGAVTLVTGVLGLYGRVSATKKLSA
jgi:hypothetical protein